MSDQIRNELLEQILAATVAGGGSNGSGWGEYKDTQYTDVSTFAIAADIDVLVPNNNLAGVKAYEPVGVTFYDAGKITGRTGDSIVISINMKALPTSANTTYIEFWLDIGGAVGELFRRVVSFPKGNGILRPISFTTLAYNLGTWEANGATVYARANGTAEIYDISYVVTRTHTGA